VIVQMSNDAMKASENAKERAESLVGAVSQFKVGY